MKRMFLEDDLLNNSEEADRTFQSSDRHVEEIIQKITNTIVEVGLIKGRHPLPVSSYIFDDEIANVHDYEEISHHIYRFIQSNVGYHEEVGVGLNQADYTDNLVYKGDKILKVYITGLTAVSTSLVAICAHYGIKLLLMHYDITSGEYKEQALFLWCEK